MAPRTFHHPAKRERGVALFVVIVFVMLSMLLALWAARTALFNELVVGNDADYQRAFEAAQALLQDAELDIRGEKADGSVCTPPSPDPSGGKICRFTTVQFPLEAKDIGPLLAGLGTVAPITKCQDGVCAKRADKQDFWNNHDAAKGPTLEQMTPVSGTPVGARYGQYTGATNTTAGGPLNPILVDTSAADRGGWYWIEVLPYDESSKNSGLVPGSPPNLLPLNLTPSVVYRITALAYGRKPSTLVVLQQTYAQQKLKD